MKQLLLFLALIVYSTYGLSQDDKLIKKADKFWEEQNFFQALRYYEEAWNQNKENPYVNFRIAQCNLNTFNKTRSLQYAIDAVKFSEQPSNEMYFILGCAYHINHQFDKAIEAYQKSDPGKTNHKRISKLVQECNNGKKYVATPLDVKVTNAGPLINTEFHEYLPYITADRMKLFFTSRRPGSTGGKTEYDGQLFEDIYMSVNKGGAWDNPVNIGNPLNTDVHDACVGLSEDGQKMFIYKSINGGDLYMSELRGKTWSKPEPLPVNTEFFETCASLSSDERTLFFVRKVGTGSRDIYMCSRTVGGAWSKPKRLPFNTEFDEDSPFMHADGKTLYFSSKGHSTMGGYDVFKVIKNGDGSWSAPINLGYPINTADDDVYFILAADGKVGYYSSGKEGGKGRQDLYSIRMPVTSNPGLAMIKGTVKDANNKPVEATITVTDNNSSETIAKYNSNSQTGEYLLALPSGKNYGITIEQKGHLFYSENVYLSEKEGFRELKKDIQLADIKSGSKVVLKNIFFSTGQYDIRPESTQELNQLIKFLKLNPTVKIEISGHTDNIGDPKLNLQLSEKRANAVLNYLVTNGIEKSRLVAKGYGSSSPISSNDTEDDRQQNRRTEFKVIGN